MIDPHDADDFPDLGFRPERVGLAMGAVVVAAFVVMAVAVIALGYWAVSSVVTLIAAQ